MKQFLTIETRSLILRFLKGLHYLYIYVQSIDISSSRHKDPAMLSNLLFWEDVTEYGAAEDRSADRLLRLHRAWDIFNTYLSEDSKHSIGKQILNIG